MCELALTIHLYLKESVSTQLEQISLSSISDAAIYEVTSSSLREATMSLTPSVRSSTVSYIEDSETEEDLNKRDPIVESDDEGQDDVEQKDDLNVSTHNLIHTTELTAQGLLRE